MALNNGETYIIQGILTFHDFAVKYIDKLEKEYFSEDIQPIIDTIKDYYFKYCKIPNTATIIDVCLPATLRKNPEKIQDCADILRSITTIQTNREDFYEWVSNETQNFIKDRRIENALMKGMPLFSEGKREEAIKLINEANAISFDDSLGLDYFNDLDARIDRLKTGDSVIPTGMKMLDDHIGGGWRNKTLVVIGAGTNVGKTLILSDISCKLIKQGLNCLYITLEIYQDSLANRIDANLADIELNSLKDNADVLKQKILDEREKAIKNNKPMGQFIIKEYAPTTLNCNQILTFVRELQLKKSFKPDFICLDYLALMAPNGKAFSDNTYGKLKTVSEELRSVACKLNIPIFTATQINREAYGSSEIGMEKTSDSMGIPMTADIMIMVSRDKDMEAENKMYFHFAKSRFSKNGSGFFMNVEYGNMRLTPSEPNSEDYNNILNKKNTSNNTDTIKNTLKKSVHATNDVLSNMGKDHGKESGKKTINL